MVCVLWVYIRIDNSIIIELLFIFESIIEHLPGFYVFIIESHKENVCEL